MEQLGGGVRMKALLFYNLIMAIISGGIFLWYAFYYTQSSDEETSDIVKAIGNIARYSIYPLYIFGAGTVLFLLLALIT